MRRAFVCSAPATRRSRRARRDSGSSQPRTPSSKQATTTAIVSQFRKDRLPLRFRSAWKRSIDAPAMSRVPPVKRTRMPERDEENGQTARLQQEHLPAVAVEDLPYVDEGHVEEPEREQDRDVGEAEQDQEGQRKAGIAAGAERSVGGIQPEDAREAEEDTRPATLRGAHRVQE